MNRSLCLIKTPSVFTDPPGVYSTRDRERWFVDNERDTLVLMGYAEAAAVPSRGWI